MLSDYLGSVLHQIPELQRRLANTEEQGKILSSEMPEHHATIEMGLQQLYDKWKNLNDEIGERNDKLRGAKEYFELIERTERFLFKNLLFRQVSSLKITEIRQRHRLID